MVKFVVFECKRFSKDRSFARIHRASCVHAKKPDYKTANTLCHGYFDRYYEALDFVASLNVGRVYDCEFCQPRHERPRATHAEEIARAVASIIKEKQTPFARVDVRDKLGISSEDWLFGYTAIFQRMRVDHPGGAPSVGSKFEGVFKNVGYGIYELTEYGEKLIKEYDC